jgi:16S rRNA (cytidine1402-2'-O)-methyltransferase
VRRLEDGEHVVYVSDAGTPGISDPGARLVSRVRQSLGSEAAIEAIPGASSLTAALSISGISADTFTFIGFLPHKKGRKTALEKIATSDVLVVLFESTHRIAKLLDELVVYAPNARITIAREITKMYEEVIRGTPSELAVLLNAKPERQKGEFVVMIEPSAE